ncbi:MAG: tRNA (adenosine(37)-N6)-dimethylallyltransferase MiaA [bacterium]|nr:tRNA (adenosine(37)-N6)-dimethylallyltransferase MiaA [bacterium]
MPSNPLLAIMGPTASGKTQLSLKLAKQFNGEIISADSRQVYFGMNIGTDKIVSRKKIADSPLESIKYNSIPHYLIDTITPNQPYSAADFVNDATKVITKIHENNHLPIVIGGTGFYIRALTEKKNFASVPPDFAFRDWADQQPVEILANDLLKKDPVLATRVDLKNPRRVIRALEIAESLRAKRSNLPSLPNGNCFGAEAPRKDERVANTNNYNILKLAIRRQPDNLRELITKRVDKQLQQGLIEEVRELIKKYGEQAPGLQAIAYRELFPFLRGEESLEEERQKIINANWQYSRRQLTWLRKEPNVVWVDSEEDATTKVLNWIQDMNNDL